MEYPKFCQYFGNIEAHISNCSDLFDSDVMFLSRFLPQTVALTLSMFQKLVQYPHPDQIAKSFCSISISSGLKDVYNSAFNRLSA